MDKLVKKEVLTVYISQFAMIIVALFCCLVPFFSDSLYLTGWKAISGLCILASVFVASIFYIASAVCFQATRLCSKHCTLQLLRQQKNGLSRFTTGARPTVKYA